MHKEKECETNESSSTKKLPTREEIEEIQEKLALHDNISRIKHKVVVLSGKGGVGKSTVATNIAVALSLKGQKVGLMDIDIHGPSIPKMLGLEGNSLRGSESGLAPIVYSNNLRVMSIGCILRTQNDAVIWRAPLKHKLIKEFLTDVQWGDLDYLIIDSPPGTGDEPLSVAQLLEDADGAVIVTTPQDVALIDVRKAITFCRQVKLPILGVVENMSGFICPHCGKNVNIFKAGGGESMAADMGVPFLARIPLEPKIVDAGDSGRPYLEDYRESETANAFNRVIEPLLGLTPDKNLQLQEDDHMPVYEYKCEGCGYQFEVTHSMNENPVVFCPECKTRSKKIITGGTGFIMKGSHQKDTGIQCGREQTCCGKSVPCETRPCDK